MIVGSEDTTLGAPGWVVVAGEGVRADSVDGGDVVAEATEMGGEPEIGALIKES
jgi:hypothetical protein